MKREEIIEEYKQFLQPVSKTMDKDWRNYIIFYTLCLDNSLNDCCEQSEDHFVKGYTYAEQYLNTKIASETVENELKAKGLTHYKIVDIDWEVITWEDLTGQKYERNKKSIVTEDITYVLEEVEPDSRSYNVRRLNKGEIDKNNMPLICNGCNERPNPSIHFERYCSADPYADIYRKKIEYNCHDCKDEGKIKDLTEREYVIFWRAHFGEEWGGEDRPAREDGITYFTLPVDIEMNDDIAFDILTQGSPHTDEFEGWAPNEVYEYCWQELRL